MQLRGEGLSVLFTKKSMMLSYDLSIVETRFLLFLQPYVCFSYEKVIGKRAKRKEKWWDRRDLNTRAHTVRLYSFTGRNVSEQRIPASLL
jgi:hypothetical protein